MLLDIAVVMIIFFTSYMIGFPFTMLFSKTEDFKYRSIIAPWIGNIIIMLISYYISIFGGNIKNSYGIVFILFLAVYIIIVWKGKLWSVSDFDNKMAFYFVMFFLTCTTFFFCFVGAFNNENQLPILLGNNDFEVYENIISYFDSFSIQEISHFPESAVMEVWIKGPQVRYMLFNVAFFKDLVHIDAALAQYLFSVYLYGIGILPIAILLDKLEMNTSIIIVSLFLLLFNCNYQWLILNGFFGQIASIGLFILAFYFFMKLINGYTLLGGFFLGLIVLGIGMSYPEMLPFSVLPMCVIVLYKILKKENGVRLMKGCIVAMLTVLLLNPFVYIHAFQIIFFADQAAVGWDVCRSYLIRALGIGNVHMSMTWGSSGCIREFIEILLSIVLLILCYMIFRKQRLRMKEENQEKYELYFCVTLVNFIYVGLYVIILFKYSLYKIYKGLVQMNYIFIIFIFYSVYILLKSNRNKVKQLVVSCGIIFIIISGVSNMALVYGYSKGIDKNTYADTTFMRKEHESVDLYIENNANKDFYIDCTGDYWNQYYLLSKLINKYSWHSIDHNFWWDINYTSPVSLPEIGDIYIGSSVFRDPIYYGDEVIIENEVYNIRRITLNEPFCYEWRGLDSVFRANILYKDNKYIDTGRYFSENEAELKYYANIDMSQNIKLEIYNFSPQNEQIEILYPGGNEVVELGAGS